jgi:CysZ protein
VARRSSSEARSAVRFDPLELGRGFAYVLRGYAVLRRNPGLARYWLMPMLLTGLALLSSVWLSLHYHDDLLRLLWSAPDAAASWLLRALYAVARAFSFLSALVLLTLLCVFGSTIIAAPFNDALSEAIEEREAGRAPAPFSLVRVLRELVQALLLAALRLSLYAAIVGPLWLLSWLVPGMGQVLYLSVWLVFTAAYFALDYVDWPATRRGLSVRARFALLGAHPLRMLGFGFGVWLCLFVPLLNLLFMPLSVAGGTLLFLDLEAGLRAASSRTA